MKQLIAASHHRKALAEQTFNRESQTVLWWASLSTNEKDAICQQSPVVLVSQQIDFELGLTLPLDPPEEVARVVFETQRRPELRDAAKMYAKRFTALCAKLEEIDQEGGRADVLTFKLLVDSLIRRAPLPVTYPEIQEEYKRWLQNHSATVWQTITEWASQRGLLPESLAADNIVFNACLDAGQASMIIEPWAMLDLHDFVIRIDRRQGLMEVFARGKKDTLEAALIPDPDHGILTLEDLREKFYAWLNATKRLKDVRTREEEEIQSKILHSPGTHTLLQLRIAKLLLFRGRIADAIMIINSIRKKDLAVIYFWGAVAYQCQYLEKKNVEFHLGLEGLEPNARATRLVNIAVQTLIDAMTPEATIGGFVFPDSDFGFDSVTFAPQKRSVPVDDDAVDYVDQMIAKDPSFADGLVQRKDFRALEQNSLRLSRKTEEQLDAAIAALSSLELLNLAEMMKDTARTLPFTGLWTSDLRKSVEAIIAAANAVKVQPPSVIQEIEQLRNLTYG